MRLEYTTDDTNFSVYPDPEHNHFVLIMSQGNQATLLNRFSNPLDAVQAVLALETGVRDWDDGDENSLPPTMFDIASWMR